MNSLKLLTNTTSDGKKMQHQRQHIKLEGGTWTCTTKGLNPQHWKKPTNMRGKLVNCKPVPLIHNLRYSLPNSTSTKLLQAPANLQIAQFQALSKRKKSGNMSEWNFLIALAFYLTNRFWGDEVTMWLNSRGTGGNAAVTGSNPAPLQTTAKSRIFCWFKNVNTP